LVLLNDGGRTHLLEAFQEMSDEQLADLTIAIGLMNA
jgi:hypothetical protein